MATKSYTDAQRGKALALYRDKGPREAARRTKIPARTISRWARSANVSTDVVAKTAEATEAAKARNAELRENLRGKLLEKALDCLERMDRRHMEIRILKSGGKNGASKAVQVELPAPTAAGVQAYATATAILLDKYRLEVGEATGRDEVLIDDPKAELSRRLAQRAQRRRAGKGAR